MSKLGVLIVLGGVLATPLPALAEQLSITGAVALEGSEIPITNAPVTITFHGHELGIHEYTTDRTVVVRTDEMGAFAAAVKVPDRRYAWTHASVAIAPTELSKAAQGIIPCMAPAAGGCEGSKAFRVRPLLEKVGHWLRVQTGLA